MEHVDPRRERLLGYLVLCALIWVGLHAVTAVRNFFVLFDCAFSGFAPLALILGAVYLLSLLAVNVMTCAAASRTAAGVLMKFWAACDLLSIGVFLGGEGLLARVLILPFGLLTPYFPLSWLREWVSLPVCHAAVFLLCLGQFLFYLLLWRRKRPE